MLASTAEEKSESGSDSDDGSAKIALEARKNFGKNFAGIDNVAEAAPANPQQSLPWPDVPPAANAASPHAAAAEQAFVLAGLGQTAAQAWALLRVHVPDTSGAEH